MNDRGVPFAAHGLDETEDGQRVDEQRSTLDRGDVTGKQGAIAGASLRYWVNMPPEMQAMCRLAIEISGSRRIVQAARCGALGACGHGTSSSQLAKASAGGDTDGPLSGALSGARRGQCRKIGGMVIRYWSIRMPRGGLQP